MLRVWEKRFSSRLQAVAAALNVTPDPSAHRLLCFVFALAVLAKTCLAFYLQALSVKFRSGVTRAVYAWCEAVDISADCAVYHTVTPVMLCATRVRSATCSLDFGDGTGSNRLFFQVTGQYLVRTWEAAGNMNFRRIYIFSVLQIKLHYVSDLRPAYEKLVRGGRLLKTH